MIRHNQKADFVQTPIRLEVAYETRRGNPFRLYQPFDFDLSDTSIRVDAKSVDIRECSGNRILLVPLQEDYSVAVSGFDERRNLKVRAVTAGGV